MRKNDRNKLLSVSHRCLPSPAVLSPLQHPRLHSHKTWIVVTKLSLVWCVSYRTWRRRRKKKKTALLSAVVKPPLIFFLLCWLQELELRWQEYYELVTLLLQWIRHHVTIFEERKFPGSYEEIEVRWYPDLMFLFLMLWVFLQEKQCSS